MQIVPNPINAYKYITGTLEKKGQPLKRGKGKGGKREGERGRERGKREEGRGKREEEGIKGKG